MVQEKFYRKELVEELRVVENLMRKEQTIEKKLYYYSAAYGATSRSYRNSFARDILLTDLVLNNSYNLLNERVNALKAGVKVVDFSVVQKSIEKVQEGLKLLIDKLESKGNIQGALEMILTASYATTGNGNYLLERGELKL